MEVRAKNLHLKLIGAIRACAMFWRAVPQSSSSTSIRLSERLGEVIAAIVYHFTLQCIELRDEMNISRRIYTSFPCERAGPWQSKSKFGSFYRS